MYYLRAVPDFRRAQGRRYPLAETLCMVVMGIMGGYCAYREIGRFIRHNQEELIRCLGLKQKQLPSYVTIRQVLMQVDFTALSAAFRNWIAAARPVGRWLSIDDKSLKSTVSEHDKAQQNFVVLVSAFCQQTGMVEEVARFENGKQREISSVRELLGRLQERGLLLTLDALHCQKKTVALIIKQRQHYLIKVKGNQQKLFAAIKQTAASGVAIQYWQESEQSRGRQVERVLELFKASKETKTEWPGLEWFIRLVRKGKRQGQAFERVRYYICSYQKANAAMIAKAIRGHWGIENRLHWEKDVTLKEDSNGIRKGQAPENLSLLKNMAINIARKSGFNSIKDAIIAFANKIKIMTKLIRT